MRKEVLHLHLVLWHQVVVQAWGEEAKREESPWDEANEEAPALVVLVVAGVVSEGWADETQLQHEHQHRRDDELDED